MVVDLEFEEKFARFLQEQKKDADARRLEMLEKDLTGTKKMFKELLLPVFGSFDGFRLKFRIIGINGSSIYVDALYEPLGLAFECEGFTFHAETITRERFSFERARIRTMLRYGFLYVPFSMDELEKRPEACRSSLQNNCNIGESDRQIILCPFMNVSCCDMPPGWTSIQTIRCL